MPKEKEITKRVTRLIKLGDKLVQDIEKDVGQLIVAASGVKEFISDIRDKFRRPEDS